MWATHINDILAILISIYNNGKHLLQNDLAISPLKFGMANDNTLNLVYSVATICYQVRCIRWEHPSLFRTAVSLLS